MRRPSFGFTIGTSCTGISYLRGTVHRYVRRRIDNFDDGAHLANIPANWIPAGPEELGSPAEATRAPAEGALIDFWVLPPAENETGEVGSNRHDQAHGRKWSAAEYPFV